jgi:hypothetical protein
MGQIDMLGGVFIRTGSVIVAFGERMVSGLVQRLGSLSFITDNAGCLAGQPFPRDSQIISFSYHEVYVGTKRVCKYLKQVLLAADPPSHLLAHTGRSAHPVESAEVMMVGTAVLPAADADKGVVAADVTLEKEKAKRIAHPLLERAENLAGTSSVPARGQPLIPIINQLLELVQSSDDSE